MSMDSRYISRNHASGSRTRPPQRLSETIFISKKYHGNFWADRRGERLRCRVTAYNCTTSEKSGSRSPDSAAQKLEGDLGAHKHVEDLVGFHRVLDGHALEDAVGLVHRGLAQLLGVHLAEALVALHANLGAALLLRTRLGAFFLSGFGLGALADAALHLLNIAGSGRVLAEVAVLLGVGVEVFDFFPFGYLK